MVSRYHARVLEPSQCGSSHEQTVCAPLEMVWSMVRQFDHPQAYKPFIRSCAVRAGDGGVGSVREVLVVSGLPAETSIERLDDLDDECHVMRFSIVGGDHRLANYKSTVTVHESEEGGSTVVTESYAVDVACGSTGEETRLFTDTIVRCNLRSLAQIAENMALVSV